MAKILVVANWKANTVDPAKWLESWRASQVDSSKIEVALACAFPYLSALAASLPDSLSLASQDVSKYPPGSYTGEVSAATLTSFKVKYCLIGHSERRKYFKETTLDAGIKFDQAIDSGLIPIICAQSLEEIPQEVNSVPSDKYLVMYEPSSAISTNGQYHAESVENVSMTLMDWQKKLPSGVGFLYGGSVNPENITAFLPLCQSNSLPHLSGFVIGHASLDPQDFSAIIHSLCSLPD